MSQQGLEFEDNVYNKIKELYPQLSVYQTKAIYKQYGNYAQGVDIMVTDKDKCMMIQCKRGNTSGALKDVNHFLLGCLLIERELKLVNDKYDARYLWAARCEPTAFAKESIKKTKCSVVIDDNIDKHMSKVLSEVKKYFIDNDDKKIDENKQDINQDLDKNKYLDLDSKDIQQNNNGDKLEQALIYEKNRFKESLFYYEELADNEINILSIYIDSSQYDKFYNSYCNIISTYETAGGGLTSQSNKIISQLNIITKIHNELTMLKKTDNELYKKYAYIDRFILSKAEKFGKFGIYPDIGKHVFSKINSDIDINRYMAYLHK